METFIIARVIHILAIVLWIGGVAMVTTVILPSIKAMKSKKDKVQTFEQIEGRFALQAKITTLLAGLSGFYMLYVLDAWDRYLDASYWWIHAMTIVWFLFTMVLYVLEPLILHKLFKKYTEENPDKTFDIIHKAHWFLLILSLVTVAGSMAGAHGWIF